MKSQDKAVVWGIGAVLLVLAVPVTLLLIFDPLSFSRLYVFLRTAWPYLAIIDGGIVLGLGILWLGKGSGPALFFASVIGLGAVATLIVFGQVRDWQINTTYASVAQEITDEQPDFGERVPWEVADHSANSAMSGINADRLETVYLPYANTYTTAAEERGTMGFYGYEAVVQQQFESSGGVSESQQCSFSDDANRRLGAPLTTNLERLILAENRFALIDSGDAWAYCDEDNVPHVVVPLTQYDGAFAPVHVPAGVAVYSGDTGEVEIHENADSADFDGPVVGLSYADRLVDSMPYYDNSGGLSGWWEVKFESSTGFDIRSMANLQLPFANDDTAHVTGLTRVSSATSVERLLTIQSNTVTAGEDPDVNMWVLDPVRESHSVIEQDIRSNYEDLGWASGLEVQEISPGPEGGWVASIGQRTNVVYRVTMDVDGNWTIRDLRTGDEAEADSDQIDGESVDGLDEDDSEISVDPNAELNELNPEELAELGEAVLRELAERGELD